MPLHIYLAEIKKRDARVVELEKTQDELSKKYKACIQEIKRREKLAEGGVSASKEDL